MMGSSRSDLTTASDLAAEADSEAADSGRTPPEELDEHEQRARDAADLPEISDAVDEGMTVEELFAERYGISAADFDTVDELRRAVREAREGRDQ